MNFYKFHQELQSFLNDTGMSRNALAKKAGVPQSQVSNWSHGKGKRFTENSLKVMSVINEYRNTQQPPLPKEIEEAVRRAWDGDSSRIGLICDVLHALNKHRQTR